MARRTKSMLKRIDVEEALAKRTCMNTKAPIRKGEMCVVVWDDPRDRYVYSKETALRMVQSARNQLDEIIKKLGGAVASDEE